MMIPVAGADRTLLALRYASVDDGPAIAALPPGGARASCRPIGRPRSGRADGRAARARRRSAGLGALATLAAMLAGCARDAEPLVFAVPAEAAARIRMVCPPGTFVGAMAVNCPQPLPRRPSPQPSPDQ